MDLTTVYNPETSVAVSVIAATKKIILYKKSTYRHDKVYLAMDTGAETERVTYKKNPNSKRGSYEENI